MKKWYLSKTLWLNIASLGVMVVEYAFGVGWITIGVEGMALTVLNFILRAITNEGVTFTGKTGDG